MINAAPLHQGDLDGLCGVYASLNCVRLLVPAAREIDFLNKLMIHIVGAIYTAKDVTGGGAELKMRHVFEYARGEVARVLGVWLAMSNKGQAGKFKSPADAMEATFTQGRPGAFIMGYEGRDSHWTVVHKIAGGRVSLYDSCGLKQFNRADLVWSKGASDPSKVIVSPSDLNWVSVG